MSLNNNNINEKSSEKVGEKLGSYVAKGLGVGLDENSYYAITAMEKVYVELESLTKNAAKNAEKLAKKQQQRQLENLKNSLELEIVTEQEYYEKLKVFRDENLRQGTDMWYKCTEEIAAYNKKVMEEAEKQQRELAEKLISVRDELAEKLMGNDKWISTSKLRFVGQGKNGADLVYNDTELSDFREEIRLLENYRDRILELKNLGNVPDGVFSDIAKMDIDDGLAAVNAILLTDELSRQSFFDGYRERAEIAESSANQLLGILKAKELQDEGIYSVADIANGFASTNDGEKFTQILKSHFDTVPESYFQLGEDAGEAFGQGFLDRIPEIMETARSYFASAINELAQQLSASFKSTVEAASGNVANTYKTTYNFNSSRDTTTQQLNAARSAAVLERLRGGV